MASLLFIFLIIAMAASCFLSPGESRKDLRDKERDKDSFVQTTDSSQSNHVDPTRVVQLSWHPRVFHYKGFLSDEESDHLISLVDSYPLIYKGANDRTLGISDGGTNIVARIEERISAWTFLPREISTPLQVTYYLSERPEEKLDYFGNNLESEPSPPLMAMVILYLKNVSQGGEILFPDSQVKREMWSDCTKTASILKPVKGNALLFFTRCLNSSLDKFSSHARCPVIEGDMWVANKLFYMGPVGSKRVSVETEESDCTDEDESCPQWAALGECQRNPVFMLGSPDYFGTCRKSCKAC